MKNSIRRRQFLAGAAAAGTLTILGAGRAKAEEAAKAKPEEVAKVQTEGLDFPVIDYHVHLDGFGIDKIAEIMKARGIQFGIVEHAGTKENKYPVVLGNDEDLAKYIAMLDGKGVLKGVQAECYDWMTVFSKEAIAKLDYVLSDAMTFVEKDGSRVELWKAEKVKIADKQDFMERYTEFTVRRAKEPIDIIACATFLPAVLAPEFDALWTEERMKRIINAAIANHVAIEIAAWAKLPRPAFLKMAKAAGAKFSFASNGRGTNAGKLDYSIQMAKELGLKAADMFTPAPAGKKPIQIRK